MTLFPEIAQEAYGWDPRLISCGSHERKEWRCQLGHIYLAAPGQRTRKRPTGCPYCANRLVLKGYNDLQTLFPEIAKEAFGWDPTEYIGKSTKTMKWKCAEGHMYEAKISTRTTGGRGRKATGCGICSGRRVLEGYNDLQTLFPEVAKEAHGWNPRLISPGSKSKKEWKCKSGHLYVSMVFHKTRHNTQCPICKGKQILPGFNDLMTTHPEVAKEAYGWDPTKKSKGQNQKVLWRCREGHVYQSTINSRTGGEVNKGSGCPFCADYGFNPSRKSWFYLMERPGELQIGITNDIHTRTKRHEREGWKMLDARGPLPGRKLLDFETELKRWLKQKVGVIEGKKENWESSKLCVHTLSELKNISGINTDII